jgi:hypothetical protein
MNTILEQIIKLDGEGEKEVMVIQLEFQTNSLVGTV